MSDLLKLTRPINRVKKELGISIETSQKIYTTTKESDHRRLWMNLKLLHRTLNKHTIPKVVREEMQLAEWIEEENR